MLLLFSSGARPRYREDIIRSLALPIGAHLQFRYEHAIVADDLVAAFEKNSLQDQTGLICYLWNRDPPHPNRFVPCRFIRIRHTEVVGSSFIVRFEVGGFAGQFDEAAIKSKMSANESAMLPAWTIDASGQAVPVGKWLMPIAANFEGKRDLPSFEATVTRLIGFTDFPKESTIFYTVQTLQNLEDKPDEFWPGRAIEPNKTVFRLKTGCRYEIAVYCFAPDQGPLAKIQSGKLGITTESEKVEFLLGKEHVIDSEYDVKRFRFYTPTQADGFSTALRLYVEAPQAEPAQGSAADVRKVCDIVLPVSFRGNLIWSCFRALVIAVGTAGPAMIAANAADKLTPGSAAVMLAIGLAAGLATVFSSLKRS